MTQWMHFPATAERAFFCIFCLYIYVVVYLRICVCVYLSISVFVQLVRTLPWGGWPLGTGLWLLLAKEGLVSRGSRAFHLFWFNFFHFLFLTFFHGISCWWNTCGPALPPLWRLWAWLASSEACSSWPGSKSWRNTSFYIFLTKFLWNCSKLPAMMGMGRDMTSTPQMAHMLPTSWIVQKY